MAIRTPLLEREVEDDADDPVRWRPGLSLPHLHPFDAVTPSLLQFGSLQTPEESEAEGTDGGPDTPHPALARQGWIREMAYTRG